ncbi:hypothetical protein SDC9_99549 [bioreactor metagenome]|uniref:Uncharacterized protein n=1 Tax=bioreactor metagenome TaxID=1076179 RepID=A0A645AIN2_9ZZZZ
MFDASTTTAMAMMPAGMRAVLGFEKDGVGGDLRRSAGRVGESGCMARIFRCFADAHARGMETLARGDAQADKSALACGSHRDLSHVG